MKVRDLERFLIENGAGAAKMDAITRRLRLAGRLPKGGRGTNAPEIDARLAATILIALAGSTNGTEADHRLEKLEGLRARGSEHGPIRFLQAVAEILSDRTQLQGLNLIRVGRTSRHATFVYDNGETTEFHAGRPGPPDARFYVEGVLPVALLRTIANELATGSGGESAPTATADA